MGFPTVVPVSGRSACSAQQAKGDINAAASLYIDIVAANNGVSLSDPGEGLRAPDPEYSQTLLSELSRPLFHVSCVV